MQGTPSWLARIGIGWGTALIVANRSRVGDAFTIEPGLAERLLDRLPGTPKNRRFVSGLRSAVARYENTGIRIEDSDVIPPQGWERISLTPREIDDVEALTRHRPVP